MIPGFFAAQAMGGGPPSPPSVQYIGGTFHNNQTSASPTLVVPVGALSGDTVVVILRCRSDRSFSGFSGWTAHQNQVVRSTLSPGTDNTRVYIISRSLTNEEDFTFTQSQSAAYGAALMVFRGGVIGNNQLPDSATAIITKQSNSSMLLAVGLGSSITADPTLDPPAFSGYIRRGLSTFVQSNIRYFTTICETREGDPAGSISATSGYGNPMDTQVAAWLAEIG